jgi:hypothetical protein
MRAINQHNLLLFVIAVSVIFSPVKKSVTARQTLLLQLILMRVRVRPVHLTAQVFWQASLSLHQFYQLPLEEAMNFLSETLETI